MYLPRKRRKKDRRTGFSPGRIYEVFYRREHDEDVEDSGESAKDYSGFIETCRKAYERNPYRGAVPKELQAALDFLGWDIPPEAVISAAKTYAMYAAVLGAVFSAFLLYFFGYLSWPIDFDVLEQATGQPLFWVILSLPVLFAVGAYYSVMSYPVSVAKSIFQSDLLPSLRVVGNIVLSMKLVPNLEKAISFAVKHGKGFLANELKQMLWDVQLGMYRSAEEGLDRIAYRLGRYSDEFKHALMRIRTSLLEADDAKRYVLLDGALSEAVEGVKNRMVAAASSLYMPSIQLFYLGIFLPLLLFIIIPVWAAFSPDTPLANPLAMVLLYNVVLPIATYYFAKSILSKRPRAYTAPEIPDRLVENASAKRRRYALQALAIFLMGAGASYYLHTLLDVTPEKLLVEAGVCTPSNVKDCIEAMPEERLSYYLEGQDLTPYVMIFGAMFSFVLAVSYYLYRSTEEKLRIQKDIMEIEKDFKDAVYVLASRMGEGKPLENALDAVSENMPESKIAEVFSRISYNVRTLGLTIKEAIFSPVFGVLRDIPSKVLRDAMRLVVAAVSLGTELASRALVAISEQLRNEEVVVERIREKTGEIAVMMTTMAYFVGPIVLGITVALEKVIISSVASINVPEVDTSVLGAFGNVTEMFSGARGGESPVPDWVFLISVAVYTLEITALLVWFSTYLHDGPNTIITRRKLAYALVVASVLFIASAWVSLNLVKGMV